MALRRGVGGSVCRCFRFSLMCLKPSGRRRAKAAWRLPHQHCPNTPPQTPEGPHQPTVHLYLITCLPLPPIKPNKEPVLSGQKVAMLAVEPLHHSSFSRDDSPLSCWPGTRQLEYKRGREGYLEESLDAVTLLLCFVLVFSQKQSTLIRCKAKSTSTEIDLDPPHIP
ncbi:hypothetical protein SRHO_G00055790 [Serrasalmus rhombeus]